MESVLVKFSSIWIMLALPISIFMVADAPLNYVSNSISSSISLRVYKLEPVKKWVPTAALIALDFVLKIALALSVSMNSYGEILTMY